MLVLTRKLEEQIRIGNNITISILRVNGNTVRVGIDAPREIRVVRGELPEHGAKDATSPSDEPVDGDLPGPPSAEDPTDEGPVNGEIEAEAGGMAPSTTAVRQFIANRARRQPRRPNSQRPGNKSLAATLTRSA